MEAIAAEECSFCTEFTNNCLPFSERFGERIRDRTLLESEFFRVVPSLGHLKGGYLLIVSKSHRLAVGGLEDNRREDFLHVLRTVKTSLNEVYPGEVIGFEHGCSDEGNPGGGCGVTHQHFHVLPIPDSPQFIERVVSELGMERLASIRSASRLLDCSKAYELLLGPSGRAYGVGGAEFESQIIRSILADHLGIESHNWRSKEFPDRFLETYRTMEEYWQDE